MARYSVWVSLGGVAACVVTGAASLARAQAPEARYPVMAPAAEYLMEREAEIALARSAAPESISAHAEVMVLGRRGYETAVRGVNGFVCVVQRSWTAGIDDPDFWNPRARSPICFNPAAARTYLPLTIRKTELAMSGRSKAPLFEALAAAFQSKELPALEPGAMCYMMSRQGYLNGAHGPWHPHLMFFVPLTDPDEWGAGSPGSPILGVRVPEDHLTIFMVPVRRWSDGSVDSTYRN